MSKFFETVQKFSESGASAAIAMVINRVAPSSSKPGDKAVITSKGEVIGWIGGGCTRGIAIKEAIAAIKDQMPRMVRILPGEGAEVTTGVKYYKMTCQSGGSVDIYIEPIMTTTKLVILGRSHIAQSLCKIAHALDYQVSVVSKVAEKDMFPEADHVRSIDDFDFEKLTNAYMVVCTQGEDDEIMLEKAIKANPEYVAFVSSRKKSDVLLRDLKKKGLISIEQLRKVRTPAGIDIRAKEAPEVAISILAEIIRQKRSVGADSEPKASMEIQELDSDLYINPVCKIPVQKSTAKHIIEHEGEQVYFCCDGCRDSFIKNPAFYLEENK